MSRSQSLSIARVNGFTALGVTARGYSYDHIELLDFGDSRTLSSALKFANT